MEETLVRIRGHHLYAIYYRLFPGRGTTRKSLDRTTLELGYGEKVLEAEKAIIEKIKKNSKVILVVNEDDICKECPKKTDWCNEFREEERQHIQKLGLEAEKPYPGRWLIRKLRENKKYLACV